MKDNESQANTPLAGWLAFGGSAVVVVILLLLYLSIPIRR